MRPKAPVGKNYIRIDGAVTYLPMSPNLPHLSTVGESIGIVSFRDKGIPVVLLCNPFQDAGVQGYTNIQVVLDGKILVDRSGYSEILPGRIKPFFGDEGYDWGSPGPYARSECISRLKKWADSGDGFHDVGDYEVWGNHDINEGGASLIYPYNSYWSDHTLGRMMAFRTMCGIAARCPVFRFDRQSWMAGTLEFATIPSGLGYGGCQIDEVEGYYRAGAHDPNNSIDHAHLGRIGHLARKLKDEGFLLAGLVQKALVEDIRLTWDLPTTHKGTKKNLAKWSAYDFLDYWPAGVGSTVMGRPFGHALTVIAESGDSPDLLKLLMKLAAHMQTPEGWIYKIHPMSPKFADTPQSEHAKKLNAKGLDPTIKSPLRMPFEDQITLYGMERAVILNPGILSFATTRSRLKYSLGAFPPEVQFEDPQYDVGTTLWGHMLPPFWNVGDVNLSHEMAFWPPYDGPACAASPVLKALSIGR
jgi:hypothetical protein